MTTTAATTRTAVIAAFFSAALYCSVELGVLLATTCRRFHRLYFWSLFAASCGVALYATGFLLRDLGLVDQFGGRGDAGVIFYVVLIAVGWSAMVTGQSLVLYSRLPLLWGPPSSPTDTGRWMRRAVLGFIVLNALIGHGSTIVALAALSMSPPTGPWTVRYNVIDMVQSIIFFMQEIMLAGIYIFEAIKMLRIMGSVVPSAKGGRVQDWRRRMLWRLLLANVATVLLSTAVLVMVFTTLEAEQAMFRALVYATKLKLDIFALDHLPEVITTPGRDDAFAFGSTADMGTFFFDNDTESTASRLSTGTMASQKQGVLAYKASVRGGVSEFAQPYLATDDAISVVRSTQVEHRRKASFCDLFKQ